MFSRKYNPPDNTDLPEIVTALRGRLLEEVDTLTEDYDVILAELELLVLPEDILEPTTSREEIEKAAEKVMSKYYHVTWKLRRAKDTLNTKIDTQIELLTRMFRVMERHVVLLEGGPEYSRNYNSLNTMQTEIKQVTSLRQKHEAEVKPRKKVLLQSGLIRLVEKQDDETKLWFFKTHLAKYGAHVTSRHWGTPRPVAFLKNPSLHVTKSTGKPTKALKRTDSRLPSEMMTLVYSFCDLEACVTLREVNSGWFSAFKQLEPLFKKMLEKRNPWITPGDGDLITWTDCVLVFVGRLRNPKWEKVDWHRELAMTLNPVERKAVVASELKFGELLPSNFKSLVGEGGCVSRECRHFHASTSDIEFKKNMWTGKTVDSETAFKERPDLSDDTKTVFQYYDDVITFPSIMSKEDLFDEERGPYISLFPSYISANIGHQLWVFPRDKPHYHHVTVYEKFLCVHTEIQGMLLAKEYYQNSDSEEGEMYLLHVESKQLLPLSWVARREDWMDTDFEPVPAASYNGLLWWRYGIFLVPTFVDLNEPHKTYYRRDRIIMGVSKGVHTQGERSRDLGRYTVGRSDVDSMVEVVDLETRTITTVYSPQYWTQHVMQRMYLGFVEGQFQARCMHPDAVDGTAQEIANVWNAELGEEE